jgi:hypothetical protein
VQREVLASLPASYRRGSLAISDDGRRFAYAERIEGGQRIVQGTTAGPTFVEVSHPVFAPQSGTLLYWAHDPQQGPENLLLVADGKATATYFPLTAPLVLSRDGSRWAVAGMIGERRDGKLVPAGAAIYSNGTLVARYRDLSMPALSHDGAHLAFIAEKDSGDLALVVDGVEQRGFTAPGAKASPVFKASATKLGLDQFRVLYLPDNRLAMLAYDADGWAVYRDAQRLASFPHVVALGEVVFHVDQFRHSAAILASSLDHAEGSALLVWWERMAGEKERWRVARDGVPELVTCGAYWESSPPLLSKDGRRVLYPCRREAAIRPGAVLDVVVDQRRYGPFLSAWGAAFSDDGRHAAFAATSERQGGWRYHLDGKFYPMSYDEVWRPRFSPDGKHLVWQASRGKRSVLVADGDSLYSYDEVLWGPAFPSPDQVAWVVRRGRKLMRVEACLDRAVVTLQ